MPLTLAFYKGRRADNPKAKPFDWLVCSVTRGPYSHVEWVDPADGYGWSSSYRDGGVRRKKIDWDTGHWDFVDVPGDPAQARAVFEENKGLPYDVFGLLFFVVPLRLEERDKLFCSEVCAMACGWFKPWTYSPNSQYHAALAQVAKYGDDLLPIP